MLATIILFMFGCLMRSPKTYTDEVLIEEYLMLAKRIVKREIEEIVASMGWDNDREHLAALEREMGRRGIPLHTREAIEYHVRKDVPLPTLRRPLYYTPIQSPNYQFQ